MYWNDDDRRGGAWYDVAQICLNGHVINRATQKYPDLNKKFCDGCGQPTTTQCEQCKLPVQGDYHVEGSVRIGSESPPPAYCQNCGAAYPWTSRKLDAARELALETFELSEGHRQILAGTIGDLIGNTPFTPVAAHRFKKLMVKVGKEGANTFRDILVDIASEAAKKIIWPT